MLLCMCLAGNDRLEGVAVRLVSCKHQVYEKLHITPDEVEQESFQDQRQRSPHALHVTF